MRWSLVLWFVLAATTAFADSPRIHHVGDKLQVEWHGRPYRATVVRVLGAGRYYIHYDGYSYTFDEAIDRSRIVGEAWNAPSSPTPLPPSISASADPTKDPIKCVVVRVRERDMGEKSASIEIDWLRGQKYPDKIPASSQEILCKTQAMIPTIEWAKANGLCGPNIKYTVQWGHVSNPKMLEGGAICNSRKPLGH